jgi:hypothetical protein
VGIGRLPVSVPVSVSGPEACGEGDSFPEGTGPADWAPFPVPQLAATKPRREARMMLSVAMAYLMTSPCRGTLIVVAARNAALAAT